MSIKEAPVFLMMVLFALGHVRHCHIMITVITFMFILGLMDDYNVVEDYFPISVKFRLFLSLSLFATFSVCFSIRDV